MANTKKSSKKRSNAYRLINKQTGTHYVVRLGRDAYDKLREKTISNYDPKLRKHAPFEVKKV